MHRQMTGALGLTGITYSFASPLIDERKPAADLAASPNATNPEAIPAAVPRLAGIGVGARRSTAARAGLNGRSTRARRPLSGSIRR